MGVGCLSRVCLFKSADLLRWHRARPLYRSPPKQPPLMFECPDLFPLPRPSAPHRSARAGHPSPADEPLTHDPSPDPGAPWALLLSIPGWAQRPGAWATYMVGGLSADADTFTPRGGSAEVLSGALANAQLVDFGNLYAAKTFDDGGRSWRVLWGWSREAGDGPSALGWQGVLGIPRVVSLDPRNTSRLTFYPIPELRSLWRPSARSVAPSPLVLSPAGHVGSTYALSRGRQLDVHVQLHIGSSTAAAPFWAGLSVLRSVGRGAGINITVREVGPLGTPLNMELRLVGPPVDEEACDETLQETLDGLMPL